MITAHYIPGPGVMLAKATTEIMDKTLAIADRFFRLLMILIAGSIAVALWARDTEHSIQRHIDSDGHPEALQKMAALGERVDALAKASREQDDKALEHRVRTEERVNANAQAIGKTMSSETLNAKLEAIERTLKSLETSIRTKHQ